MIASKLKIRTQPNHNDQVSFSFSFHYFAWSLFQIRFLMSVLMKPWQSHNLTFEFSFPECVIYSSCRISVHTSCHVSCFMSVLLCFHTLICLRWSFLHFLQKNKLYPDDSSLFNYQLFPKPKLWPLTRKTHPNAKIIQEGIPLAYICIHLHDDWTLKSWPRNLFASRIFFTLFFLERACNWLWSRFTVSLIW